MWQHSLDYCNALKCVTWQRQTTPSSAVLWRDATLSVYNAPRLAWCNSASHPSRVGKWVPASAGKAKARMVHSVSGWTRGVQVKLWDPLRTRDIPERLRGVFTTRCYTNSRLPLLYTATVSVLVVTAFLPECLRDVFTTRCYTNQRLPYLTLSYLVPAINVGPGYYWDGWPFAASWYLISQPGQLSLAIPAWACVHAVIPPPMWGRNGEFWVTGQSHVMRTARHTVW